MTTQRNLARYTTPQVYFAAFTSWHRYCSRSSLIPCATLDSASAPATLSRIKLFLRKQLALYEERQVKLARATNAIRLAIRLNRTSVWTMTAASFNLGSVSIREVRVSGSRLLVLRGHFDADMAGFKVASKAACEGFVKHLKP